MKVKVELSEITKWTNKRDRGNSECGKWGCKYGQSTYMCDNVIMKPVNKVCSCLTRKQKENVYSCQCWAKCAVHVL
jgi:hypothetical protein